MAVKIELKRSAVPGKVPTTSSLALGEVAINTYDGRLFFKKNVNGVESIVEITGGSGSVSTASYAYYAETSSLALTASYFSGSISNALTAVSSAYAATASYTPNAIVTASVNLNTITFTKGNNSTFSITVNTGSGGGGTGTGFPFSGSAVITGSLLVSGSGITGSLFGTASYAQFALSASYATSAQNAQDILIYVKNVTGVQIDKGKVVRISGATGDNALINLADWTDDPNSANTLGLTTQNIANDGFGYVMTEGTLIGIDTSLYTPGQLVFLGSSGSITGSAPIAPLHAVRLGQILRVQSINGSMYVRIDNGYELDELHDVRIVSPVTGQALVRSGSLWVNGNPASSSFAATASLAPAYVQNSVTASMLAPYVLSSQTSSMTVLSASFASTASRSITSSFAQVAVSASFASNAASASYVLNAISASFASTASSTPNAIITASVSQNTITFTKGDGTTFPVTVNTGSGGGGGGVSDFPYTGSAIISGSLQVTGSIAATGGITGSLLGTASFATLSNIQYVTNSIQTLSQIEVLDYDANVAVDFTGGRLKFIFGTPATQSITSFSFNSTFLTDRFNQVLDDYTASAVWNNGGYSLISASIFEAGTVLAQTGTGTTLAFPTITSGSHTYVLHVTSSNPSNGSILVQTSTLTGTLSKSNPGNPTISATPTVQLNAASNQIEQGATGSISFTSASGASNGWVLNFLTSSRTTPVAVVGALTGSASIIIAATASYSSSGVNGSDNSPALVTATFTKIRSLRGGASPSTSFTQPELETLSTWDTTLGGVIGTIAKGTTTASGQSVTINWTGDKYHYIVYNGSLAFLTNITSAGFGVLSSFTSASVGEYKVYRTNLLQAGGAGQAITYVLT